MFVLPTAGAWASVQVLRGQACGGAAPPKTLRAACDREEMSRRQNLADWWSRCSPHASAEGGVSLQFLKRIWTLRASWCCSTLKLLAGTMKIVEQTWITVTVKVFIVSKGIYCSMCLRSMTQVRDEGKTPSNVKTPWEVVILVPMLVYKNKVNFSEACLLCWREQFGTTWVSWDGGRCWVGFPWLVVGQGVGICGCLQGPFPCSHGASHLLVHAGAWTGKPLLFRPIINMKLHSSSFGLHSLIKSSLRFYLLFILYWVQPPHEQNQQNSYTLEPHQETCFCCLLPQQVEPQCSKFKSSQQNLLIWELHLL